VPGTIEHWFAQFQAKQRIGLRNLDLLNVMVSVVGFHAGASTGAASSHPHNAR